MARYISKYGAFKKTVRKGSNTLVQGANGPVVHETMAPHVAYFQKAGATPWEREFAIKHFGFKGIAEGEDPIGRISSYDTDEEAARLGWSAEEKQRVEEMLDIGQRFGDYVRVERPRVPTPWPTYDQLVPAGRRSAEYVAQTIAETVQNLGLDPEQVIAYERENRNREDVIAALQPAEDAELVVQA